MLKKIMKTKNFNCRAEILKMMPTMNFYANPPARSGLKGSLIQGPPAIASTGKLESEQSKFMQIDFLSWLNFLIGLKLDVFLSFFLLLISERRKAQTSQLIRKRRQGSAVQDAD